MNKSIIFFAAFSLILLLSVVSAADCQLGVTLLNQDPYPATPGDYVKLVFQVTGVENPSCGTATFELLNNFPISFDPGAQHSFSIKSGTFVQGYNPSWLIPYKVRVDPNAVNGENEIKVSYGSNSAGVNNYVTSNFNLTVNNTESDFNVIATNYVPTTGSFTLGILNIGKSNVEALTIAIPQQDNITILGSSQQIIGSLNSNDDTTVNFQVGSTSGNKIIVDLSYNDLNGIRRSVEKDVYFDAASFDHSGTKTTARSGSFYFSIILVFGIIIYIIFRYFRNKKRKKLELAKRRN